MNATPDRRRHRSQLLLTSASGSSAHLQQSLLSVAESVAATLAPSVRVCALTQIVDDPFPSMNPGARPFDAVLELEGPVQELDLSDTSQAFAEAYEAIAALIDQKHSGAVMGWPQTVIPGRRCALRYLYVMRRLPDVSRESYFEHYFHRHSDFAFHLKGIESYTQVHIDPSSSDALTEQLGLGVRNIDSVTELTFDSVNGFFAGVQPRAAEAGEDELRFVDRERSVSFCSNDHTIRSGTR